jgi:hypothetical protein
MSTILTVAAAIPLSMLLAALFAMVGGGVQYAWMWWRR